MFDKKTWLGIVCMAIFFSWLLFIPFYGPGQHLLTSIPEASHIFVLAHIAGMLHSGWLYAAGKNKKLAALLEKTAVFLVAAAVLTAFLSTSFVIELVAIIIMGYATSWFVIRWACWLSLPAHSSYRGLLMGIVLALANLFFFTYSALLYLDNYDKVVLILSSVLNIAGAVLIIRLPHIDAWEAILRPNRFNAKDALPPLHLLIFALFAFSAGGILYNSVYTVEIEISAQMRNLPLLAYIVGAVFLGLLADRYSRTIFLPGMFVSMGIGFVLLIINEGIPVIHLIINIAILFGLVCADLYYWLTLSAHGRQEDVPFVFAVGLSFHLLVISMTGIVIEYFLHDSPFWFSPAGVIGTIIMFLGILYSFRLYVNSLSNVSAPVNLHINQGELLNDYIIEEYSFTKREAEITLLLMQGYSYPQISEQLFISMHTVKYHVRNILRKTDVSNRHELIKVIRSHK